MKKIKNFIKNKIDNAKIILKNVKPFRYYCPNCALRFKDIRMLEPTASCTFFIDKRDKKPKFYIRCRCCNYVTPAYETTDNALEMFEDKWVSTEYILYKRLTDKNRGK